LSVVRESPELKDEKNDLFAGLRQAGIVMTIPMMLAIGPLVGYFAGAWLDRRLGTDPWLAVSGAILGFAAAVNETIRIIRILQREQKDGD